MLSLCISIFGLFIGSFLGVLGQRLPRQEDVISSRSHCDHCGHVLSWYELIPVFSYVFQAGKCTACSKRLSIAYPIIELSTAGGFYFLSLGYAGVTLPLIALLIIYSTFVVIVISDVSEHIIPDSMLLVMLFAVLGFLFAEMTSPLLNHALTGVGSFLFLFTIWFATGGRGMGFGDVKLVFVLGLFLGYPLMIMAFYVAFISGAIISAALLMMRQRKLKSKIAFGPFLLFGTACTWVFSEQMIVLWGFYL